MITTIIVKQRYGAYALRYIVNYDIRCAVFIEVCLNRSAIIFEESNYKFIPSTRKGKPLLVINRLYSHIKYVAVINISLKKTFGKIQQESFFYLEFKCYSRRTPLRINIYIYCTQSEDVWVYHSKFVNSILQRFIDVEVKSLLEQSPFHSLSFVLIQDASNFNYLNEWMHNILHCKKAEIVLCLVDVIIFFVDA